MLRVSKQTDYGIVLLSYLAIDSREFLFTARELAQETKVPLPMVSKVLKALTREGLLESHRGVRGGYTLARSPGDISLYEIINAMEGPVAMTECLSAPGDCRHEGACPIQTNWQKINQLVYRALESISLEDMVHPMPDALVTLRTGSPGETPTSAEVS